MDEPTRTTLPAGWAARAARVLNAMAGEGISMCGCDDPCDLMMELAEHLGVADDDYCMDVAILKLEAATNG